MGDKEFGLDLHRIEEIAREIVEVRESGVEIAIVVGGGNFYRGMAAAAEGMDRATADYAGMLATVLNGLALQDALERFGAQHADPVGDRHRRGRRALHPPPRDEAPREGPRRRSSRRGRAIRSSRPTPPLRYARSRSAPARS